MPLRVWRCSDPNHKGVRAPGRMRADDVRRFCWPCSVTTGYLVQRHAPALERKRKNAKAKRLEREQAARERAHEDRTAREVIDGVDVGQEIDRLIKLPALRDELPSGWRRDKVSWTLHRSSQVSSGHAYARWKIHLTIRYGATAAEVKTLLLHELAHYVMANEEHHGGRWARCFARAAREAYDVDVQARHGRERTWELDGRVFAALGGNDPQMWALLRRGVDDG